MHVPALMANSCSLLMVMFGCVVAWQLQLQLTATFWPAAMTLCCHHASAD